MRSESMEVGVDKRPRSVIVVDDDPILRELMSEQLSGLGWQVSTAEDGDVAINAIGKQVPDLAIVDLNMPVLDGFAVLRHLRQNPRTIDLPIIVCTSHNEREPIDEAYRLGASHFVTKPINWPMLMHHVQFVMRSGDTERELRLAQNEALAASRMKSAMFQVLSHELKTPLTALIGMTDVLERTLRDRLQASETEQLEYVVDAARRLNGVVNDILLLSKAVGGTGQKNFEPARLSDILDDSLVGLRRRAKERNVELLVRPIDLDVTVSCDSGLIRQAFARLIDNAIKFSTDGGTVEIWGHVRADGHVLMSVRDEGPGLTAQKLKECLQPFVQENMTYGRPTEGMGLGLPIARTVCEAHGGELLVQSSPGHGLLAAIVLPSSLVMSALPEAQALHG